METVVFDRFINGWDPHNKPSSYVFPLEVGQNQLLDADGVEVLPSGRLRWNRNQFSITTPRGTVAADSWEVTACGTVALRGMYVATGTRNGKSVYIQSRPDVAPTNAPRISWDGAKWELTNYTYATQYYYDSGAASMPGGTWYSTGGTDPVPTIVAASSSGTVTGLWEYKDGTYNQLICQKGTRLYALETAWSSATPTQAQYGYSLFTDSWYCIAGTVTASMNAIQCDHDMLFVAQGGAVSQWDGATYVSVGLAPPGSAPAMTGSSSSDLTTWTESDADGQLTVATSSVTGSLLDYQGNSYLASDLTAVGDFTHQFSLNVSAFTDNTLTNDVRSPRIWALYNTGIAPTFSRCSAGLEVGLNIKSTGKYQVTTSGTAAWLTYEYSTATTYYYTVSRSGSSFTVSIYSDSGRTTLIETRTVSTTAASLQYVCLLSELQTAGHLPHTSAVVSDFTIVAGSAGAGLLPAGTYSYYYTFANDTFESMPSPITDIVVGANSSITLTGINASSDTTVARRRIYRAYTSDTSSGARGETFGFLGTINDNTTTTFYDNTPETSIGEPMPYDYAIPPRGAFIAYHQGRIFIAGSQEASRSYDDYSTGYYEASLFWSESLSPYFPGDNVVQVGDTTPIRAMVPWRDDLYILKDNSVWVMSGYSEDTFMLSQVSERVGGTAIAASPYGVMWAAMDGYYMTTGGLPARVAPVGLDWPWSTGAANSIAFHDGKFHILQTTAILKYDPVANRWEYQTAEPGSAGIRSYAYGTKQSHLLLTMAWVASGDKLISVVGGLDSASQRDSAGTDYSAMFSPISITFPPIEAPPGEEIVPLEVWVDGSWTLHGTAAKRPKLYINTTAAYSDTTGNNAWATTPDCPQGGACIGVPHGYNHSTSSYKTNAAPRLYVQIKGESALEFDLRRVTVGFVRRRAGGA